MGGARSRFGRSYIGAPDAIAAELAQDAAVQAADQRVFGLAFGVDITVALGGDPAGYDALWERGVQMLQTNRPEVVAPRLE